jgi:hypothetical protein
MTVRETLSVLSKNLIAGLAFYGISMSLAYGGYVGQDFNDLCNPTYCCPKDLS